MNIQKMAEGLSNTDKANTHEFWLMDYEGNRLLFAYVASVKSGRLLWEECSNLRAGQNLVEFEIRKNGEVLYTGSYTSEDR